LATKPEPPQLAPAKLSLWLPHVTPDLCALKESDPDFPSDRLISRTRHLIQPVLAEDMRFEPGIFVVYVHPDRLAEFAEDLRTPGTVVLWFYGAVLGWCHGLEPSPQLRQKMKQRYGYEFPSPANRPNCAGIVRDGLRIAVPEKPAMDTPEPGSFAARFAKPAAAASAKPRSQVDQIIARNGQQVHKLKAKDTTGRWAYYFVYVERAKEPAFLAAIKGDGAIDLSDYGRVIASCYGEAPDQATRDFLKETYGFDV